MLRTVRRRGAGASLGIALAVALVTGCSGESEVRNPYAAEFAKARDEVTAEVSRAILEDDIITAAEYDQVKDESVQCMRDQGLEASRTQEGGVKVEGVGSTLDTPQDQLDADRARREAIMAECEKKVDLAVLEALYWAVADNPENTDLMQAVADCLVRGGHRDEGYDKADYIEEMSSYGTGMNVADDGSTTETPGALAGQAPPLEMTACERDPEQ